MNSELSIAEVIDFLSGDDCAPSFDGGALSGGAQLARSKLVKSVQASILDTGDVTIAATVLEKNGASFSPELVLWREGAGIAIESDCKCEVRTNCRHGAAILAYLQKGGEKRIAAAFGEKPHADMMTEGQVLVVAPEPDPEPASEPESGAKRSNRSDTKVSFRLRVSRRPQGERSAWMPEFLLEAYAVYDGNSVALSPAGHLPPLVLPDRKIVRDRALETEAMNRLYALDLLPGAEEPPQSLRKLDRPPVNGTLWAVDEKKWPHPEFYWLRFRHDAAPAFERQGWEVRFAPGVGCEPLVFKTETWSAEIIDEGKGWFHLSAGFEIDGEDFELQPILAALVKNRFLEVTEGMPSGQEFMIFLPDGRGLALPVGRFRVILETLGELLDFKFTEGPVKVAKLDAALLATALQGAADLKVEVPEEVEELSIRIENFESIQPVPVPDGMKATLREYQLEGFYWMQFLIEHGLHGILADDMGLGKTMQTLTHILHEIETGRNEGLPSLVIAPTSVVRNWQREAEKFAPGLDVVVIQGANRKSEFRKIPRADLVLTSYALVHRDLETLRNYEFHIVALDEAQYIKNPGAQVTGAVRQIRAKHRLCLSGTPVENNLGEIWSLIHFLMPGFLGTSEVFKSTYQTPIERDGSEVKRKALARRLGPLILRRTKHDVAKELPPKTEILHLVEMNEVQKDLYETVRSTMDKQVRQALALRGQESQIVFLDALLKLRQICCHPDLLKDRDNDADSAKFEYLVDLLVTLRSEGHRVLLFSQFTSMLAIIEAYLVSEEIEYLKLTGATKDRQELVERFQGGEGDVFLISLKAGGTGLTLTGADTVIHYDPWWNPAAENQATDRAYRIGQDKAVFVHKLICQNTVEERIQKMQGKKDDLATDLLSGATTGLDLTPEVMAGLLGE